MVVVTYRKKGIKITHVWFASQEQINTLPFLNNAGDLVYLHGVNNCLIDKKNGYESVQCSIIKSLLKDEDELFSSLGKHLKQYIKRSYKDSEVNISILDSNTLAEHPNILEHCKSLFEKMYEDKNMNVSFNNSLMNAYIKNGAMVIGYATICDKPIGFSATIIDDKNARLWLTAFDFRNHLDSAQMISRTHQRMDWEIILWCKNKGIESFDFGGIYSFDNPNGIDKFKMNFERNGKVSYNNYLIPNSFLGRLAMKMYKW